MKSPVTDSIFALRPYQGGKPIEELARERGLTDIVKLASNESSLGPSPACLEAARQALSHAHRYPDGAGLRLRQAIAKHHNVSVEEVAHGNGSNELIELIVRTFMTPDHHMVFGRPGVQYVSSRGSSAQRRVHGRTHLFRVDSRSFGDARRGPREHEGDSRRQS